MNHSEFDDLLRQSFRDRAAAPRNVRLPSEKGVRFGGDTDCATLFMSEAAVQANMQDDAAAFEGWSVVLMTWCNVQRVVIDWHEPADLTNGHYQRFLYRLSRFEDLLGQDVVRVIGRDRLAHCRITNGGAPVLNTSQGSDTTGAPSPPGSEADLEKRLAGASLSERKRLMDDLGLTRLDRQMPVGVFDGRPSLASAIFTGGKSAIDLVGIGEDRALYLFELKTPTNSKVGALSEMFFYSMVLHDVRRGRIKFLSQAAQRRMSIQPIDIAQAPRIHVRLLAEAAHPLLNTAVFGILNDAAVKRGWAIDYAFQDLGRYLDKPQTAATPDSRRQGNTPIG